MIPLEPRKLCVGCIHFWISFVFLPLMQWQVVKSIICSAITLFHIISCIYSKPVKRGETGVGWLFKWLIFFLYMHLEPHSEPCQVCNIELFNKIVIYLIWYLTGFWIQLCHNAVLSFQTFSSSVVKKLLKKYSEN